MDVVGLSPSDKGLALAVVFVRQGAVQGGRAYFWPGLAFEDASELLWSFLGQCYAQFMPPGRILLPWMPLDAEEEEAEDPEDAEQQAGTLSGVREERPAEAGGLARDDVHQRSALGAGEYAAVDLLAQFDGQGEDFDILRVRIGSRREIAVRQFLLRHNSDVGETAGRKCAADRDIAGAMQRGIYDPQVRCGLL